MGKLILSLSCPLKSDMVGQHNMTKQQSFSFVGPSTCSKPTDLMAKLTPGESTPGKFSSLKVRYYADSLGEVK